MSQTITNRQGETVQVLDKGDLNWALWRLVAFFVLVGLPTVVSTAVAIHDTKRDLVDVQDAVNVALPDQRAIRRTMDSLLIELRAARRELALLQGPR